MCKNLLSSTDSFMLMQSSATEAYTPTYKRQQDVPEKKNTNVDLDLARPQLSYDYIHVTISSLILD